MAVFNYPYPKAPQYPKPKTVDDCLPQARRMVKKTMGRAALGPVKKGDNVLIVTLPDQDEYVREAVTQALREEGAARVDFMFEHELVGGEPRRFNADDGWREADTMQNAPWDLSGSKFYIEVLCHSFLPPESVTCQI